VQLFWLQIYGGNYLVAQNIFFKKNGRKFGFNGYRIAGSAWNATLGAKSQPHIVWPLQVYQCLYLLEF
jgi:hypothetical protein